MNIAPARRIILTVTLPLAAVAGSSVLALFVYGGSLSDLGRTLIAAVLYSLPILAVEAATEKTVRRWADRSRFHDDAAAMFITVN